MEEGEFRRALLARVMAAAADNVVGAGDEQWSAATRWKNSTESRLNDLATRLGRRRIRFDVDRAAERLETLLVHAPGFARTMALLEDDASRRLLLDLLARRVAGGFHVPLPVAPVRFERLRRAMARLRIGDETLVGPMGWTLQLLEYRGIRMWGHPAQLVAFELGQYEPAIEGEIVLDGGAGFGETALAYARQVGPGGKVIAVELDGENLEVIERNLALNPELASRIEVVQAALWDADGQTVEYEPRGGESTIGGDGARARTLTIDSLDWPRIDRVKLDIEGAESRALNGAMATIARDRPRLAISAYHRIDDLAVLPSIIAQADSTYRFALGHFTPGIAETVLLGRPAGS